MTYNISSDKFHHPLLKSLLDFLSDYFRNKGLSFYVIGATARDIIMALHGVRSGRATLDLDIAIALSSWKRVYQKIKELLDIEISSAEESRLINQILETNNSFSYEEALACLKGFREGLCGARE